MPPQKPVEKLKAQLRDARGVSESVIAVNADIRGFSAFAGTVDAVDVAAYLSRVYTELLDRYYGAADFVKLTGDGLMALYHYATAEEFADKLPRVLERSVALVHEFADIASNDVMIYYPVPPNVGIGLSRGAVSRLVVRGETVDYAGRPLNAASRLMNAARPRGVIFDSTVPIAVVPDEMRSNFSSETLYFAGIAERNGLQAWYTHDWTSIPLANTRPLVEGAWLKLTAPQSLAEWKRMATSNWTFNLPAEPVNRDAIEVTVTFTERGDPPGVGTTQVIDDFTYGTRSGKSVVRVHIETMLSLVGEQVDEETIVMLACSYLSHPLPDDASVDSGSVSAGLEFEPSSADGAPSAG
jgi:class 3 adenylate cyclase